MREKVSYAQNAEDIRVWRAFAELSEQPGARLTYVDVGANEPQHLSITASLYDMGWRGLLIEADPQLAAELRRFRPLDTVIEEAASADVGELTFYRVPGTGLGTMDATEAHAARERGFEVIAQSVPTRPLDDMLDRAHLTEIHFMSIDVEGAEAQVLSGLSLQRHRPWVLCIEAVFPGTQIPSHAQWEGDLLAKGYALATFDGINRWYVASEHAELMDSIALGLHALDIGVHGWTQEATANLVRQSNAADHKNAWQRELILHDVVTAVPVSEYERQIAELRAALIGVEGSRSWKYTRVVAKVARRGQHMARRAAATLPGPIQRRVIRARHGRHVTANYANLVDQAFLGEPREYSVGWVNAEAMPSLPRTGFEPQPLSSEQVGQVEQWLDAEPYDTDDLLRRRMDNHDDELGRTIAALRVRTQLATTHASAPPITGSKVLVDARCLQSPAFGSRGIGRFANAALRGIRTSVADHDITLLIDPRLEELPADLVGDCAQVAHIPASSVPQYAVLIQPSPMTATMQPLLSILDSNAHKVAIVYDFIPRHFPSVYLAQAGACAEYASALDALRRYDEYVCISQGVERELAEVLQRPTLQSTVAWPADLASELASSAGVPDGPIVVMTGDEARKNTYGALAAIALATAGSSDPRDVLVIGMAGQDTRVHHWSIHAAMRPGECRTAGRLTDQELRDTLRRASVVLVPSFDEGLSLPVIEAIASGANVVASDIPAHRELLGGGSYLVNPANLQHVAKAIRRYAGTRRGYIRQRTRLLQHQHHQLESVLAQLVVARQGVTHSVDAHQASPQQEPPQQSSPHQARSQQLGDRPADKPFAVPPAQVHLSAPALRVGMATPWPPQRSGIADFSAAIGHELRQICDLTLYTTADARVDSQYSSRPVDALLCGPSTEDVVVSILGNSHFHIPFLDVLRSTDSVTIAHDTRMIEFYAALRGRGGAEQVMTRGQRDRAIIPAFDEQLDDMRLLQNAGMWEVAHLAKALVMHSPTSAAMIERQTGVRPWQLPFAAYRAPAFEQITESARTAARERLGMASGEIHLASFGFVDVRTKLVDVIVEAGAWLTQWGYRVHLHLVGAAEPAIAQMLNEQAKAAGLAHFAITGFVTDAQYRDYIMGVDLGIQLRVSPFLGVSGPLADMAAYGTPGIGSRGLAVDVDTPDFIDAIPDDVSSLLVAEAIEHRLAQPVPLDDREAMRRKYLQEKSPAVYAEQLLSILERLS